MIQHGSMNVCPYAISDDKTNSTIMHINRIEVSIDVKRKPVKLYYISTTGNPPLAFKTNLEWGNCHNRHRLW